MKSGIILRQMLKILKKQYLILIGTGPLKIFLWMKVELFNETLNIFPNYNPNKNIKCDHRQPPRMTDNIKKSLKQRSKLTKIFYKNGQKNSDYIKVLEKSEECTSLISEAKKNYILKMTSKLEDSNTASKTYWPILNCFLYNKKIHAIPPLLVDGNFIPGFCEKANLFNNCFASICTAIKNNSRLCPFIYKARIRIYCFCVTNNDILSIINSLNSSKANGYDNISVETIKTCNESVTISLKIIFVESLKRGIFPDI